MKKREKERGSNMMQPQDNSYALITGASSGIGKYIAIELASRGHNVLLVALSETKLSGVESYIQQKYNVMVDHFISDLSEKESPLKIYEWTRIHGYSVNILVNNAAVGGTAVFQDAELHYLNSLIMVNIRSLVLLTRYFITDMKELPEAYILNVGSLSAWFSIPYKSLYSASKAFVMSFSRALRTELKDTGISITLINPNGVRTNAGTRARIESHGLMGRLTTTGVKQIAFLAVEGMLRKKFLIVPGFLNKILVFLSWLAPYKLKQYILYSSFSREIQRTSLAKMFT